MEQIIAYCSLEKVNVTSTWTATSPPTKGSTSISIEYTLPLGAIVQSAILYCDLSGGIGGGTEWANGVELRNVGDDPDAHYANLSVADVTPTSMSVLLEHKSRGAVGKTTSSKVFKNIRVVINYILPGSSWSMDKATYAPGDTLRIEITPVNSSYSHKIQFSFVEESVSTDLPAGANEWSYVLSDSQLYQIPNSVAGTGSIVLTTLLNGEVLAEETKTFSFVADTTSIGPTVEELQIILQSPQNGAFAADYSAATIVARNVAAKFGATIVSQIITVADYSGSSPLSIGKISTVGTYVVTLTVIDSRGVNTVITKNLEVVERITLSIGKIIAGRCDDNNVAQPSGTRAYIIVTFTADESVTTCAARFQIRERGTYSWGVTAETPLYGSGVAYVFPSSFELQEAKSYEVKATLTDRYGNEVSASTFINTSYVFMRWEPLSNMFGFGCMPESTASNRIQVSGDWDIIHGTLSIYDIIHPVGSVVFFNTDQLPTGVQGTWTIIGNVSVGSSTIYAWRKTGAAALSTE